MGKKNVVRGLSNISKPGNIICKSSHIGKKVHVPFKSKENLTTKPLRLVHMDLYGPSRMHTPIGKLNFMLMIDYYSTLIWVAFLKEKS